MWQCLVHYLIVIEGYHGNTVRYCHSLGLKRVHGTICDR